VKVDIETDGKHRHAIEDAERAKVTITVGPARLVMRVRPVRARGFASDSSSTEATFELDVYLGPRGWRTVTRHQVAVPMMPPAEQAGQGAGF
jgi:hypothetical protein